MNPVFPPLPFIIPDADQQHISACALLWTRSIQQQQLPPGCQASSHTAPLKIYKQDMKITQRKYHMYFYLMVHLVSSSHMFAMQHWYLHQQGTWSIKLTTNYQAEDSQSLFIAWMLRQLTWSTGNTSVLVLHQMTATEQALAAAIANQCPTGRLQAQTLQDYLPEATETAIIFWNRPSLVFTLPELLLIVTISISLLCLHSENMQIDG